MPVQTKRWNDPASPNDGFRLLVCRYRPRGVRKADECWDAWMPALGPSRELHAAFYGKEGEPIGWGEYRRRYLGEMKAQKEAIAALARRVDAGERITLLCSSACVDARRCHRSLLQGLIEAAQQKCAE
jgi:uncharacterized protein YeaO (DUF488 family)